MNTKPEEKAVHGRQECNCCITTAVPVVCPLCHAQDLRCSGDEISCPECGARFHCSEEFADLVIGDRFSDETSDAMLCYEEESNEDTTLNYWVPLFRKLWPNPQTPPKLLSVGCGIGLEIDILRQHGFDSMGIDPGNRSKSWRIRQEKDRLVLANGMKLPFDDNSFDATFCGCVYPHVGVIGDSNITRESYHADRLSLAQEMIRVLKPGGYIIVSSPNRLFPLDIFHGREPGEYIPRLNPPWSHFLLSVGDYRNLFQAAGASRVRTLPVNNYWGFVGSRGSLKGTLLSMPIRLVFSLVSLPFLAFLRGSPINPWIVVMGKKDENGKA